MKKSFRYVSVTTINETEKTAKSNHKSTLSSLEAIGFVVKSTETETEEDVFALTTTLTHITDVV
jgi:hypothetical protein